MTATFTPEHPVDSVRRPLARIGIALVAALAFLLPTTMAPRAEAYVAQSSFSCGNGRISYMLGIRADANVTRGGQYVSVRYWMADARGYSRLSGWENPVWEPTAASGGYATGISRTFAASGWQITTLQYQVAYYYANGWHYTGWVRMTDGSSSRICYPRF